MKSVLVVAAVRSRMLLGERQYWVCRRDKGGAHPEFKGLWEYPGGKVEVGESIYAALLREMKEEFGVDALVGKVLSVIPAMLEGENQEYDVYFLECAFDDKPALRCHTETKWCTVKALQEDKHLPAGTVFNKRLFQQQIQV